MFSYVKRKDMVIASIIVLFSVIDAFFTLIGVSLGVLDEINPFLSHFINTPLKFIFIKLSLTFYGVIILLIMTPYIKLIKVVMTLLMMLYACIIIYHVLGLLMLT
jgi:hypothetical protein